MKKLLSRTILLAVALLGSERVGSAIDNMDVVVIAGQSNAVGYGFGPGVDPVCDPRVWQWAFNGTPQWATNPLSGPDSPAGRFGAGLHFGIGYANKYLAPGRRVMLVPTAVSNTGFAQGDWRVGGPLYNQAIHLATAAINSGVGNKLVGIIWVQGETDARQFVDATSYQNYLTALIQGFRASIPTATAQTPFLIGGMVPEWMATIGKPAYDIATVHGSMPSIVPYCAYVGGPWGCNNGPDEVIHYNAVGQAKLGDRYLGALATVGPTKSSPQQIATVRASDNSLWIKCFDGSNWSYWSTLGGFLPEDAAVVRSPNGKWDVFGLGRDSLLWTRSNTGGVWTSWIPLGQPNPNVTWVGRPTVVQTQNGRLDVVVTGSDQSIWTITWQNGAWGFWSQMPGGTPAPTSFAQTIDGGALLFAWGHVGGAFYNALSKTGLWSGWIGLGGNPNAEVNGITNWDTDFDIFTIAPDMTLQTARMVKGVPKPWISLGGTVGGGHVWPIIEPNENLTVLAMGAGFSICGRTRTFETGPWSAWYKPGAGGVVVHPPTLVRDSSGNLYLFGLNTLGQFSCLSRVNGTWSGWKPVD